MSGCLRCVSLVSMRSLPLALASQWHFTQDASRMGAISLTKSGPSARTEQVRAARLRRVMIGFMGWLDDTGGGGRTKASQVTMRQPRQEDVVGN